MLNLNNFTNGAAYEKNLWIGITILTIGYSERCFTMDPRFSSNQFSYQQSSNPHTGVPYPQYPNTGQDVVRSQVPPTISNASRAPYSQHPDTGQSVVRSQVPPTVSNSSVTQSHIQQSNGYSPYSGGNQYGSSSANSTYFFPSSYYPSSTYSNPSFQRTSSTIPNSSMTQSHIKQSNDYSQHSEGNQSSMNSYQPTLFSTLFSRTYPAIGPTITSSQSVPPPLNLSNPSTSMSGNKLLSLSRLPLPPSFAVVGSNTHTSNGELTTSITSNASTKAPIITDSRSVLLHNTSKIFDAMELAYKQNKA